MVEKTAVGGGAGGGEPARGNEDSQDVSFSSWANLLPESEEGLEYLR